MAASLHDRPDLVQFVRFVAVGVLNTAFGYLIFAALTLMSLPPIAAVTGGTILGVLFNFQSTGRLVFGASGGRLLPRFAGVYAVQALADIGLLHLAIGHGIPVLVAQAVVLPPLVVITFFVMRRYVFARRARPVRTP